MRGSQYRVRLLIGSICVVAVVCLASQYRWLRLLRDSPSSPRSNSGKSQRRQQTQKEARIFYLDPSEQLPQILGVPECVPTDPGDDFNRIRANHPNRLLYGAHFSYDQNAGGYFLGYPPASSPLELGGVSPPRCLRHLRWAVDDRQALKGYARRARTIDEAQLVYVDMFCYHHKLWMLKHLPAGVMDGESWQRNVTDQITAIYTAIQNRFHHRMRDLVFYMATPMRELSAWCKNFQVLKESISISIERMMACNRQRMITVPYNINLEWFNDSALVNPRDTLVTFIGGADGFLRRKAGQRLRYSLIQVLHGAGVGDAEMRCHGCAGEIPHSEVLKRYQQSKFCLAVAGDTASSRRLAEVIFHGCVPVVVGPPWHEIPFEQLAYENFTFFLEIMDTTSWVATGGHTSDVQRYTLPARLQQYATKLADLKQVIPFLESVTPKQYQQMAASLHSVRDSMLYTTDFRPTKPGANDLILQLLNNFIGTKT